MDTMTLNAIKKTVEAVNNKNCYYNLNEYDLITIAEQLGGYKNKPEIIDTIEFYSMLYSLPKFI